MTTNQQKDFEKWWETEKLNYALCDREKLKLVAQRAWEAGVITMATFAMESFRNTLFERDV